MADVRIGDVGTIMEITITDDSSAVDVSSASATKNVILHSPSHASTSYAASFTTDGTDGKIKYALLADNVNEVGTWKIQGHVVITAGTFFTSLGEFECKGSL